MFKRKLLNLIILTKQRSLSSLKNFFLLELGKFLTCFSTQLNLVFLLSFNYSKPRPCENNYYLLFWQYFPRIIFLASTEVFEIFSWLIMTLLAMKVQYAKALFSGNLIFILIFDASKLIIFLYRWLHGYIYNLSFSRIN